MKTKRKIMRYLTEKYTIARSNKERLFYSSLYDGIENYHTPKEFLNKLLSDLEDYKTSSKEHYIIAETINFIRE